MSRFKTEAEGYAASLRQQATWIDSSRYTEDLDADELRAAAEFIERQGSITPAPAVDTSTATAEASRRYPAPEGSIYDEEDNQASHRAASQRAAFIGGAEWASRSAATSDAPADWQDDPSADERWNAGLDFGMVQFCAALGVDPHDVTWDAATETLDGDVAAVIGHILDAGIGEDWRTFVQWQPANTAPKDGSPFMAWCPIIPGPGDTDATPDGEIRIVWWEDRGQFTSDRDLGNEVFTGWRALPAAPISRKERGTSQPATASQPSPGASTLSPRPRE